MRAQYTTNAPAVIAARCAERPALNPRLNEKTMLVDHQPALALQEQLEATLDNTTILLYHNVMAGGTMGEKTNFDRYLERKLKDAKFRARFEADDRAWDVALQLAALRHARGLTQKQVAVLLGTKQQAIARLEDPAYTGHSLSMVRRYVEALGASLDVTIVPDEAIGPYDTHRRPKPLLRLAEPRESYDSNTEEIPGA
jgi:transcriptional regulator with XRE-family HTH domain